MNRFIIKRLVMIVFRKFLLHKLTTRNRVNPSLFFRFRKRGLKRAAIKMFFKMAFITE
jgi:hypothetical protein